MTELIEELTETLDRLSVTRDAIKLLAAESNPDDPVAARAMLDLLTQSEAMLLRADLLATGTKYRDAFEPLIRQTFAATAMVQKRLSLLQARALLEEAAASTIH